MRQLSMKYIGGKVDVPEIDGISIVTYKPEYREEIKDALVPLTNDRYNDETLDKVILKRTDVNDEGVFLAMQEGKAVGTATSCIHVGDESKPADDGGTLHMVSALPEVAGRKVGAAVCASVINYLVEKGCKYVDLTTDDFRKSAIIVYLRLGFRPVIDDEEMNERWQKIAEELNLPVITEEAIRV